MTAEATEAICGGGLFAILGRTQCPDHGGDVVADHRLIVFGRGAIGDEGIGDFHTDVAGEGLEDLGIGCILGKNGGNAGFPDAIDER